MHKCPPRLHNSSSRKGLRAHEFQCNAGALVLHVCQTDQYLGHRFDIPGAGDVADVLGIESDGAKQVNDCAGAGFLAGDGDEHLTLFEGSQVMVRGQYSIERLDDLRLRQGLGNLFAGGILEADGEVREVGGEGVGHVDDRLAGQGIDPVVLQGQGSLQGDGKEDEVRLSNGGGAVLLAGGGVN